MRIIERYRSILNFAAILLISLSFGLLGGLIVGRGMLRQSLVRGGYSLLLFRPAYDFFTTYGLINSRNDMKRLTGYYTLLDARYMNEDFLMDRYTKENSPAIKRTIVWILGFSGEKKKVFAFCDNIYKESSGPVKRQIQESLIKLDPVEYRTFMQKNGIKSAELNQ